MQGTESEQQQQLGQLFKACDLDGSGYIDQDELASICSGLSVDELSDVFKQLDKDGDGRISIDEFAKGYRDIALANDSRKRERIRQRLRSEKSEEDKAGAEDEEYVGGLDEGLRALSCQEQVCELYQNLHSVDKPELVTQFENILLNVLKDVRQYQLENERLEKTYRKEKDEHDKHLRRLEEEMDQQVQSVEERVRRQEKERLESEKIELRNQLDSEIIMLQHNLKKLQQTTFKLCKAANLIVERKSDYLRQMGVVGDVMT
ncbi:ras and EF-hand domain-containing protein homolog [Aplysia californica]|uniref:Ras and EF-hand domain-containing protein homolog n=1 Tax=Aplysia californica TaxID=6500 RepID=A0ABM1VP31_APLCA|nr:ras and EF-hand domain-containing protein homolog [Aplysia californica]